MLAERFSVAPAQIALLLVAETSSVGLTVMVAVLEEVQPFTSVPVTLYEVVDAGEAVIELPVPPVFHV
jgi:hypothetical protein